MYKKIKHRIDIINMLPENSIGVELGVAKGNFSYEILEHKNKLKLLYSIDRWAGDRHHDTIEYKKACHKLCFFKGRSKIIKMSFEQAVDLFPNDYFDFIYIDGYAHTGQNNGKTLDDWYPKLKKGGIFSGHDYAKKWEYTIIAVDKFIKNNNLDLNITTDDVYNSWWTIKK
jgi:hypothetical protein